jgi:hypothetical protein
MATKILLAVCVAACLGLSTAFSLSPSKLPCLGGARLGSLCPLRPRARAASANGVARLAAQIHYGGLQHAGFLVKDTAKSVEFYTTV